MQDCPNYFYDANRVRYELYQTNGQQPYNWLFFPGGPGADSSYLRDLVAVVDLPGNVWLIDFPGNGDNVCGDTSVDFDTWLEFFPLLKKFENPIVVGHSFGGMLPLLFPELEKELRGLIILNAAPTLWLAEAVAYAKQFTLPDLSTEMQAFTQNPSQETFNIALDACTPYYFPSSTLDKGRKLLSKIPFPYQPAVWWQRKAMEMPFSAKWVPQRVPTLIIGARFDCICPFSLFEKDSRFQRDNIQLLFIEDAGHLSWVENPQAIHNAFEEFSLRLTR